MSTNEKKMVLVKFLFFPVVKRERRGSTQIFLLPYDLRISTHCLLNLSSGYKKYIGYYAVRLVYVYVSSTELINMVCQPMYFCFPFSVLFSAYHEKNNIRVWLFFFPVASLAIVSCC